MTLYNTVATVCEILTIRCWNNETNFNTLLLYHNYIINSKLFVLYGCETWSLIVKEEKELRVFEYKILRKIFVPKRDEETGEWKKLHTGGASWSLWEFGYNNA